MKPRDAFHLVLTDAALGDPDASPATNRLKRALKVLLRSFGLRCTRAALHPADDSPASDLTPHLTHDGGESEHARNPPPHARRASP